MMGSQLDKVKGMFFVINQSLCLSLSEVFTIKEGRGLINYSTEINILFYYFFLYYSVDRLFLSICLLNILKFTTECKKK